MIDLHQPPAYIQLAQVEATSPPQSENREVTPLDVSKYLPPTANYATVLVTVTPRTGIVVIYTPGYEASPTVFRGPQSSGEIRIVGPIVYVGLEAGATSYEIRYLNWREP